MHCFSSTAAETYTAGREYELYSQCGKIFDSNSEKLWGRFLGLLNRLSVSEEDKYHKMIVAQGIAKMRTKRNNRSILA